MTLYEFIKLTPDNWPHPDECITRDYHDKDYELDWNFGKNKIVSISITMSGDLIWAAIVGDKNYKGKVKKPKTIPTEIFNIFKDLGYSND
jgi:hypothetical protein